MYIMATYNGIFYDCDKTECKTIDEYRKSFILCSDEIVFSEVSEKKYNELEKFRKLLDVLATSFECYLAIGDYQRAEEKFFNSLNNEDDIKFYRESLERANENMKIFYTEIEPMEEDF